MRTCNDEFSLPYCRTCLKSLDDRIITGKMNRYVSLFFRRIGKDLKQKELLPLKLLFFMHSSSRYPVSNPPMRF